MAPTAPPVAAPIAAPGPPPAAAPIAAPAPAPSRPPPIARCEGSYGLVQADKPKSSAKAVAQGANARFITCSVLDNRRQTSAHDVFDESGVKKMLCEGFIRHLGPRWCN